MADKQKHNKKFQDKDIQFKIKHLDICPDCDGTGDMLENGEGCENCNDKGMVKI